MSNYLANAPEIYRICEAPWALDGEPWTTIQQKVLIHKICNVSGILYLALEKLKPPLMDANRAKQIL